MAKRLSLLAAVISINICSVSSELRFDPAGLPVAVLTAGHTEILQQTIHLRNTGSEPASVRVVAQCDENLSPHQPPWMLSPVHSLPVGSSEERSFNFSLTAVSLTQGMFSSRICAYNQSELDTRSGLSPVPWAQLPVQVKVLCNRSGSDSPDEPSCTINTTQLAVYKPQNQQALVFFEAIVSFTKYPWPEWSSSANANTAVIVDRGQGSVFNVTLWPPGNSCGTYLLRGTTAVATAAASSKQTLQIDIDGAAVNSTKASDTLNAGSASAAAGDSPCSLKQDIDTAALPVIGTLPFLPAPKGSWSPITRPFSLPPAYLVAGGPNHTAHAALSLTNIEGIAHSVQLVTNCYNDTSAGLPVSWLNASQRDVTLAPNTSASLDLTYNAVGLAAGTYRAQLCLFADYGYGAVSSVIQVQLIVLCSRFQGYESSPAGCTITFSNITRKSAAPPAQSSSSPVSFDGSSNAINPLTAFPVPEVQPPDARGLSSQTPVGSGESGSGSAQQATFAAELAFNRPVVGAQSLQSLAGMLYSDGVTDGRITGVKENTSRAPNCGMYSMTGYVSGGADGSVPNITVQVAGLYDVTNVLNACTVQAKDQ